MTPLEALVELTNMGVDEQRIGDTYVRYLPRLYDTIMEECSPPERWAHLIGKDPCDSELRFSIDSAGLLFKCDEHDRIVYSVKP